jgi:hypothetical protein
MRAIARTIINLVLVVAVLAVDGWLTTQRVYQHASHDARIVMLVVPVVVTFVVACIALYAVPSKAQLKRRNPGRTTPYTVTARRR